MASIILAFVFLGSNLGLAMGTHFCGGHAMESAVILGYEDLSCGMMPEPPSHHDGHHDQNIDSIPCCANEFQSLQIADDFQNSVAKVFVEHVSVLAPLFVIADFSNTVVNSSFNTHYAPPIRTDEVTTLFQIFRI